MATLRNFFETVDFYAIIDGHKIMNYVETGTGYGESIEFLWQKLRKEEKYSYNSIHTIEIHSSVIDKARENLAHVENCMIWHGESSNVLKQICPTLIGSTLFFLDAHFPGADFGLNDYLFEKDELIRLPLEEEIKSICSSKDIKNDFFIIDDLRLYMTGNYEMGNITKEQGAVLSGIDFIMKAFNGTHMVMQDLRYTGFLMIVPNTGTQ